MFVDFFYHLRDFGLKVSSTEWLALMQALCAGHARADLNVFYHLARCLLVKRESDYDTYDRSKAKVWLVVGAVVLVCGAGGGFGTYFLWTKFAGKSPPAGVPSLALTEATVHPGPF